MVQRLVDRFQLDDRVEIRLPQPFDGWHTGRVVGHAHPGIWVETADGNKWFVTNTRHVQNIMQPHIAQKLIDLNHDFYNQMSASFASSRSHYQDGYPRLLSYLPAGCNSLLDVGCGEGRFGRFLFEHKVIQTYVGVDGSEGLLTAARESTPGTFLQRDISRPGFLEGLGPFPAIACLSTLQHIPGRANRRELLREMAEHLDPGGVLMLANWQFKASARQHRKIVPWTTIGLTENDVETDDYLLTWQREGSGLRYVSQINLAATHDLVQPAGLELVDYYRSDGREGNLNLYTIWRQPVGGAKMAPGD